MSRIGFTRGNHPAERQLGKEKLINSLVLNNYFFKLNKIEICKFQCFVTLVNLSLILIKVERKIDFYISHHASRPDLKAGTSGVPRILFYKMAAPLEVILSSDSNSQFWNLTVFDLHSGSSLLSYRGGNSSARTLTLLRGQHLLSAQLGKNFINVWEIQRKVRSNHSHPAQRFHFIHPEPLNHDSKTLKHTRPDRCFSFQMTRSQGSQINNSILGNLSLFIQSWGIKIKSYAICETHTC